MERFWNIIHYFIFRFFGKFDYYFYTYTGLFKIYDIPFIRKRLKNKLKMDNPKQWLLDFNNSDIGQNIMISGGLLGVLPCVFMLGLGDLLYAVWGIPRIFDNKDIYILCLIIFWILTSILLKNYKKYFKEFNKKPRKWKVRWAWISLAVVLFPFVFFFWAMSMMG